MLVPILMESKSEEAHARKIAEYLEDFGIKSELYVVSAFKTPELVLDMVSDFNKSGEDIVYITIPNGSNSLSGMISASSIHPVIASPTFRNEAEFFATIHSMVRYPEGAPSTCVVNAKNTADAAIRMLAMNNDSLRKRVAKQIVELKESIE